MSVSERRVDGRATTKSVDGEQDQVRAVVWRSGQVDGEPFELEDLSEIKDQEVLFWVDLYDPDDGDDATLCTLADELGFTPAEVHLAIDNGSRPRAARHASHTFITTYATRLKRQPPRNPLESRVETSRISAFLLPRGLVTVRHDHLFDMSILDKRWSADKHLWRFGSGGLLYVLFDLLVDEHFDTINRLEDEIEDLEERLFAMIDPDKRRKQSSSDEGLNVSDREMDRSLQVEVFRLRKELVAVRRVVLPMREVVKTVDHDPLGGAKNAELDALFDELGEQILRLTEWTDSLHDTITAVYETSLAVRDGKLNEVMKKLTGWAAIIAVPTLITGWFGQNVYYPGANASSGLLASTIMIIVIALPLYFSFKKHDWI